MTIAHDPDLVEEEPAEEPADDADDAQFTVEVPAGEEEYDASMLGEYDPKLDLSDFKAPTTDLLKKYDQSDKQVNMEEQQANQLRIKETLESFGISISTIKATFGHHHAL